MSKSPSPSVKTMSFTEALQFVTEGKKVRKSDWGNEDYMFLDGEFLSIFRGGKSHQFVIREVDLLGTDYSLV